MRRIVLLAALAALLSISFGTAAASAGQPAMETEVFGPNTFYDEFLSEECGVDVYTTETGRWKGRFFEEDGSGLQFVGTINVSLVATAGDNSFRFKDVGADVAQAGPDGSLTLLITGQVPFGWTGVLKLDPVTEEIVLEPHWVDATRACAALTS